MKGIITLATGTSISRPAAQWWPALENNLHQMTAVRMIIAANITKSTMSVKIMSIIGKGSRINLDSTREMSILFFLSVNLVREH